MPVFVCPEPYADFHLMPGRAGNLGFLPGINQFCRPAGLHGYESRIDLADSCLLGAEAASDPGLFHTDSAFGNAKSPGQDPAAVEYDLGGGDHVKPCLLYTSRSAPHLILIPGLCIFLLLLALNLLGDALRDQFDVRSREVKNL